MQYSKLFCVLMAISMVKCISQPHIVVILADDLGWNDVGHHGSSQIPTPNIDALAYNGISLKKHYTQHICTPSRTALLTGKYPIRTGMQGYPIRAGEPRILPLNVPTIAEKMSTLGYSTHLVGKWHLGHKFRNATPIERGFQSYLGHWNGFCGYFDYESNLGEINGFDLHRDYDPAYEYAHVTYATELYTDETIKIINKHNKINPMFLILSHLAPHTGKNGLLEVKDERTVNAKYNYITNPGRRLYADIVEGLDASVGKVVKSLEETGMLENTIVIFMSDNGAQTYGFLENFGSNWPLRGLKFTLFEGGIRNTAILWSKLLMKTKYVENTVFHITDWFPTLYAAAGGNIKDLGYIDGINQWPLISKGKSNTNRSYILLNIDEKMQHSAIMTADGRYKLIQGSYENGIYDNHAGDSGRNQTDPLYNIYEILNSDVNTAILKVNRFAEPLTENDIFLLRSELEIDHLANHDIEEEFLSCQLLNGYCLFDLYTDPRETKDIQYENPAIFDELKIALLNFKRQVVPQINQLPERVASNPVHCNNTWFTWGETDAKLKCSFNHSNFSLFDGKAYGLGISYILVFVVFIVIRI